MRPAPPSPRRGTSSLVPIVMMLAAVGLPLQSAAAQQRDVFLELGASQVSPPSGVTGDAARFLVGGLRGSWLSADGSGLFGSLFAGRTTDGATGGDFLSGEAAATGWRSVGGDWSVGLRGRALGYLVGSPFPYRAGAVEVGPSVRLLRPNLSLRLDGAAGVGRSRIEFESVTLEDGSWEHRGHMGDRWNPDRYTVTTREITTELWRYGGAAELLARTGPLIVGIAGGAHRTAGGTFKSAGLRVLGGRARVQLGIRLDVWWTPYARETAGGLTVAIPVGGSWSVRGFLGRTEPDPLTLATSSGGGGGLLLGRRILGSGGGDAAAPLHEVLSRTPGGAALRFALRVPRSAEVVELVGDFSLWEPLRMERAGGEWILEVEVEEGFHHFGFLVDGSWYVPEGARDVVPDEWGRESVTLLVEPLAQGRGAGGVR